MREYLKACQARMLAHAATRIMKLRESIFSRRQFLNGSLAGALAAAAATVLAPIARFVWPSRREPLPDWVALPAADFALEPGEGKPFAFGKYPGLLLRMDDGEWRAFLAVCTHLNCTVGYRLDQRDIYCACHLGQFDLAGNVVSGPPPRPLTRFVVEKRGTVLVVAQQGIDIDEKLEGHA